MARISQEQMMRELVCYAHEEMRNRGIEEAAQVIEDRGDYFGNLRWRDVAVAEKIRELKRDPSKQLSDWWGPRFEVIDMVPIGA